MKKILCLGDGISSGYAQFLANYLGEGYNLTHKYTTDSRSLLSLLKAESAQLDYDTVIFNCGLHDIKYNWMDEKIQVETGEYENNLRRICAVLKNSCARVFFINSTPVYDEIHNSTQNILRNGEIVRRPNDIEKYNAIAQNVANQSGITVIDLYTLTRSFGTKAVSDHIHYHTEYQQKQAEFIADTISENK